MNQFTRRGVAAGAVALPLFSIRSRPADAAEFTYKWANNLAMTHPLNIRGAEAVTRIREATSGRLEIQVFPSNQLGSDTDTLSQLRSGAVEMFTLSGLILATLVPPASINGMGFAFSGYPAVWSAMDGALGAFVRSEIAKRGLFAMERQWDNGFRHITTSNRAIHTPADLRGLKLRVPPSPLWTNMFTALGAAPASINFSEVYSALQTRVVDGQENPLAIIDTARLFEVQRFCSLSNHMWDGFWFLANSRAWGRLPADVQAIAQRELNASALQEREDVARLNGELQGKLTAAGMQFNAVEPGPFRNRLSEGGFYREWRGRYGEDAWRILEGAVGALA